MGDDYTIADIATWGWVRNIYGFYGAGDLVGIDNFPNVKRTVDAFVARPAVAPRPRDPEAAGHEAASTGCRRRQRALGLVRRRAGAGADHRERRPRDGGNRLRRRREPAGRRLPRAARTASHPREGGAPHAGPHPHRSDRACAARKPGDVLEIRILDIQLRTGLGLHLCPAAGRRAAERLRGLRADDRAAGQAAQRRHPALGHGAAAAALLRRDGRGAAEGVGNDLHHPAARPWRQPRQQAADPGLDAVPAGACGRRAPVAGRRPWRAGRRRGLHHGDRDGAGRHASRSSCART